MTMYYHERDMKRLDQRAELHDRLATEPEKDGETEVERINRLWKTIQDAAKA